MKELSIEEKVKAYDEAKARMSRAYNSNRCTIGFMNEIFPELKESEDERIRKELIRVFSNREKYVINQSFGDINVSDILAWLEKQGEQNHTDELVEQNSAWSEEDDYNLQCMIAKVDSDIQKGNVGRNNELIDWLRTLKDRVQPKLEWGEEDRILQDSSISYLCNLRDEFEVKGWNKEQIQKCINWLISLRPQKHWKPSDEQIKGIECAIKTLQHQLNVGDKRLDSLYADLKKLS